LVFWTFAVVNYALAALMYSLLARFVLSFFMAPDSTNYIYRFFVRVTDPALRVVQFITPRAVPQLLLVLLSAVWILMVRFALLLGAAQIDGAASAAG
jgi:uncharacterized protein YggT (Ycf19 family)